MKLILMMVIFMMSFTAFAEVAASSPQLPIVVADQDPAQFTPPPDWLKTAIHTVEAFPGIGPQVSLIMKWMGVLAVIMTSLVGFLLLSLKSLTGVLNAAQLQGAAEKIKQFQDSKFMYYLKYFSMFNAKKPEEKPKA